MAIITVAPKGNPGMEIPRAIASTAPKPAPEETPRVPPSARGFLRSPCIAAPEIAKDAPTKDAFITLGSLTANIIEAWGLLITSPKDSFSCILDIIILKTSFIGIETLPITRDINIPINNINKNPKKCLNLKVSNLFIYLHFFLGTSPIIYLLTNSDRALAPSTNLTEGLDSSSFTKFSIFSSLTAVTPSQPGLFSISSTGVSPDAVPIEIVTI